MSFRRPPSDVHRMTSLKVDNLPYRASADDLLPLFEKYGDVGDIYLPMERASGRSRGFAFVRYYDKRDAEDALDALNGRTYDGRDLRISMDGGRPRYSGREEFGGGGGGGGRYRGRSRSRSRERRSRSRERRSRSRDKRSRSRDRRSRSKSKERRRSRSRSKSNNRSEDRGRDRGRSGSRSRSRSR